MENNYIEVYSYTKKYSLSKTAMEKLNKVVPKGCPFSGYTLFNLLVDLIEMYSWKIRGKMLLVEFIRMLQKENYIKAVVYGDAIIERLV